MNILKKIMGILLIATMAISTFAVAVAEDMTTQEVKEDFHSCTGIVKEIRPFLEADGKEVFGKQFVLVENDAGTFNLITDENTYWVTEAELAVGANVTGFYDATLPITMIHPPQYQTEVMVVDLPEGQSVKTAIFDKNLVSTDNMLKLNLNNNVEIILQDGTAFDGEITNRKLVVIYDVATMSIPAQTTPKKIAVLFEKIMPVEPTAPIIPEVPTVEPKISEASIVILNGEIVVENEIIKATDSYVKDGVVMVPLRVVAENLAYKITWEPETKTIRLNNSITLSIGKDYYTFMRMAPIELGTAPELKEGNTFVPLTFFKSVMQMNNAYVLEGQIVINNGEIMQ